MCYSDQSDLSSPSRGEEKGEGDGPQNVTANQTRVKRKRGGQKGNRNARKHGFYSDTLSPAQTSQLRNITNLEGVDLEIALIRVKLQSSLQHDPGNRRVITEASRSLVKWYSEDCGLDATDRKDLKAVVENVLAIASMRQSVGLQGSQKQMANQRNESYVPDQLNGPPYVRKRVIESQKKQDFSQNESSQLALQQLSLSEAIALRTKTSS